MLAAGLLVEACVALGLQGTLDAVLTDSPSGAFRAEIQRAPGQERVADALARWRLEVFEHPRAAGAEPLWSASFPHRPGARTYHLADDGRSLSVLELEYTESRPLIRIWNGAGAPTELSATELDIDRSHLARETPQRWLADERGAEFEWHDSPRGPELLLRLTTPYGEQRFVHLPGGAVTRESGWRTVPYAEPPASRAEKPGLRVPYATRFQAAPHAYWGEAVEVAVSGSHATPNWMFVGFEVRLGGAEQRDIVLSPISAPPPKNSVQAQVLQRFDARAKIFDLMPGRYTLRVEGCSDETQAPLALEVRPARAFLDLQRTGGFAGLDQAFRVYPSGVLVRSSTKSARATEYRVVAPAILRRLVDAAAQLPVSRTWKERFAADGFDFRLSIWDGATAREFAFQDANVLGPLREIVELLTTLP
jgi:hypothetical protein